MSRLTDLMQRARELDPELGKALHEEFQARTKDPHRVDLPDALPKLLGLADYAENKPAGVRTVIAVSSEIDGKVYTLDLGTEAARAAVRGASDATAPYLEVGAELFS